MFYTTTPKKNIPFRSEPFRFRVFNALGQGSLVTFAEQMKVETLIKSKVRGGWVAVIADGLRKNSWSLIWDGTKKYKMYTVVLTDLICLSKCISLGWCHIMTFVKDRKRCSERCALVLWPDPMSFLVVEVFWETGVRFCKMFSIVQEQKWCRFFSHEKYWILKNMIGSAFIFFESLWEVLELSTKTLGLQSHLPLWMRADVSIRCRFLSQRWTLIDDFIP